MGWNRYSVFYNQSQSRMSSPALAPDRQNHGKFDQKHHTVFEVKFTTNFCVNIY
jgi:hypothetical protein